MALELIAVDGMTISHSPGSTTSGGTFVVATSPSLKTKAENKGVYKGPIIINFSGGNSTETLEGTGTIIAGTVVGTATISPTATKSKEQGQLVIRDNDGATFTSLTGTFLPNAGPPAIPFTPIPPTDIEITNPNQTKVKSE